MLLPIPQCIGQPTTAYKVHCAEVEKPPYTRVYTHMHLNTPENKYVTLPPNKRSSKYHLNRPA